MFWYKYKGLYESANERLKDQSIHIGEINKENRTYKNILKNFNYLIDKDENHSLNIYIRNDNLYYITEQWSNGIGEASQITLKTYNLSSNGSDKTDPVSILEGEIIYDYVKKIKYGEMNSINTLKEERQGHGSKILKRFIYIAETRDITIIEGRLYNNTPIGLENLKSFYQRNGFKIQGSKFSMVIKQPKSNIL